jgi:hypothetical protein
VSVVRFTVFVPGHANPVRTFLFKILRPSCPTRAGGSALFRFTVFARCDGILHYSFIHFIHSVCFVSFSLSLARASMPANSSHSAVASTLLDWTSSRSRGVSNFKSWFLVPFKLCSSLPFSVSFFNRFSTGQDVTHLPVF